MRCQICEKNHHHICMMTNKNMKTEVKSEGESPAANNGRGHQQHHQPWGRGVSDSGSGNIGNGWRNLHQSNANPDQFFMRGNYTGRPIPGVDQADRKIYWNWLRQRQQYLLWHPLPKESYSGRPKGLQVHWNQSINQNMCDGVRHAREEETNIGKYHWKAVITPCGTVNGITKGQA